MPVAHSRIVKPLRRGWLLAALVGTAMTAAASDERLDERSHYRIEELLSGLDHPWSLAFLPDGDLLFTQRSGALLRRDGETGEVAPVAGVPSTYVAGQGGLFDVLIDPGFASNRLIYISYADGDRRENRTAVFRGRLDGKTLTDGEVILRAAADKNTAHHYGGRMAFLGDGTLLLTVGDGYDRRNAAQDLNTHFGKLLRFNPDGSAPPDNPFAALGGAAAFVLSYGHRNPQGIAVDPASGRIWLHEHGPRGGDEVNLIDEGGNYGWPAITYGRDYSGAAVSPYTALEGMQQPQKVWSPSIAPAGLTVYRGDAFPEWRGDLLIAALKSQDVRRLDVRNGRVADEAIVFAEIGERIRDVREGPQGYLYLLTDGSNGRLLRVTPRKAAK
ncbi:MAG: PQQ-dependent sugar dehydrogenase [Pseudomonadota bacterium]